MLLLLWLLFSLLALADLEAWGVGVGRGMEGVWEGGEKRCDGPMGEDMGAWKERVGLGGAVRGGVQRSVGTERGCGEVEEWLGMRCWRRVRAWGLGEWE